MLVLLLDQRPIPIINQTVHPDSTGDHVTGLDLPFTEGFDDALEIFPLVT